MKQYRTPSLIFIGPASKSIRMGTPNAGDGVTEQHTQVELSSNLEEDQA